MQRVSPEENINLLWTQMETLSAKIEELKVQISSISMACHSSDCVQYEMD